MATKFILALYHKHIFNPVAIAVVITAFVINQSARWWVGTLVMLPFVLIGGILIVRKIKRADMVFAFLITSVIVTFGLAVVSGQNLLIIAKEIFIDSPLFFFAFIMLTEPLTTPPTKTLQIWYGGLVGFLMAPQVHIGSLYFTPELALVVGNVFSYVVSPKSKLLLTLKEKVKVAEGVYDYVFGANRQLAFAPGQYLEWTLGHASPDSRGNRRYFTIASSPTENEIRVGIKFYQPASSFKASLVTMKPGDRLVAGQLAGDFTLPKDPAQKLVFIAGGIGVTPFRSMIKYMLDTQEKRDIVFFYSNKTVKEIAYTDLFDRAVEELDMRIIYTLTDLAQIPPQWQGEKGFITAQMVERDVPDYAERMYYISGPRSMITTFEKALADIGCSPPKY